MTRIQWHLDRVVTGSIRCKLDVHRCARAMTRRRLAALAIAASMASVALVNAAYTKVAEQKPVHQSTFHVDGSEAPASVDSLWGMATAVIAGAILEVRDASEPMYPRGSSEPATLPQTIYVVEVQNVFKSDDRVKPNATSEVKRLGGVIDRGSFLDDQVDANFSKFKLQKHYVLFLKSRDANSRYYPVAGPDSAFELNANRVVPFGKGTAAQQLAIGSPEELFALLEKKGGRK